MLQVGDTLEKKAEQASKQASNTKKQSRQPCRCAIEAPNVMFEPPQFLKRQLFFNLLEIGTGRAAVLVTRSGRRGVPGTCCCR